jgi:hypothetical protein
VESTEHLSRNYRKKLLPATIWKRILARQQEAIYRHFESRFPPRVDAKVLNIGVNADLPERDQYFLESRYPYLQQVVASGLESDEQYRRLFPEAEYVQAVRGEPLPFEDRSFDLAFCTAVVEHVGSRDAQRAFVEEVLRVSRSAFFTTPNRWYPVDLHTQIPLLHYLPGRLYRPVYRALGFDFFSREENLNLLDRKTLAALVPAGRQVEIATHRFLGLPSNLLMAVDP